MIILPCYDIHVKDLTGKLMKTKLPFTWHSLAIYAFIIAIIALQIYALINVETPPVSFKDEIIPGEYSICRGSALHYKNTFVINHKSPVVYIRSVAKGFVTNPDVPHVTVQQDDKPLYFNVWEAQERVNTLVYTPTATLQPGQYTLIVSASGINSDYRGVAMYALMFTLRDC